MIRSEFEAYTLNERGADRIKRVREVMSETLSALEGLCGADGRDIAVVRTKLQEAQFFAVRAVAVRPENQTAEDAG